MTPSQAADLQSRCDLLRSLHRPGTPLLLPNAWDVVTARAVVAAGFPVVATTSWGVAETLGYEDEERAPADEMLATAARIARAVEVPVTIDAEAGYGMQPVELVAALGDAGPQAAISRTPTTPPGASAIPTGTRSGSGRFARPPPRRATRSSSTPGSTSSWLPGRPTRVGARGVRCRGRPARERLPRGGRRLRVPDPPVGGGPAASLHVRSSGPGERRTP